MAGTDQANDSAVLLDGSIVIGGTSTSGGLDSLAAVKLTLLGAPDTSFGGGDGLVTVDLLVGGLPANLTGNAVDLRRGQDRHRRRDRPAGRARPTCSSSG